MKKTILLFLVAITIISCDSPIQQPLDTKEIFNFTVNENDWLESTDANGLNRYYSCHFKMYELGSTVYNDGAVIAYIENGNKQQTLPYVRHYESIENSTQFLWTRTVDFEYSNGGITFYVTNSDFVQDPPDAMNFRVILIW